MRDSSSGFKNSVWFQVAPAVLYALLIFWLGSVEMPDGPEGPPMPSDKVMHLLAFGGMQLVVFRAVRWRWRRLGLVAQLIRAAALAAGLGALLELYQAFLPYRSCDVADWVADVIGVALASGLIALLTRAVGGNALVASEPIEPPSRR